MPDPRDEPDAVACRHCGRQFAAITYKHLRRVHEYEDAHPIYAYAARFPDAPTHSRRTRRRLRNACEDRWERRGQRRTRAWVLAEIRRRDRAGRPLAASAVGHVLEEAARRRFGSWDRALRRAGLNPDAHRKWGPRWSRADVIREIRRLARRGEPLQAQVVRRRHSALFVAARKRFPHSWLKALRAAGLDPMQHRILRRGRWTQESAAAWTRKRAHGGVAPRASDVPADLHGFVCQRVDGGWGAYVTGLGLRPATPPAREWTAASVVAAIRRRRDAGEPLNAKAVRRVDGGLMGAARSRFGSWDAALRASGLDPFDVRRMGRWSRDAVLRLIRARARRAAPLTYAAIGTDERPLYLAALRFFRGGWAAALRAAQIDPRRHLERQQPFREAEVRRLIRAVAARRGSVRARDVPTGVYNFVRFKRRQRWADYLATLGIATERPGARAWPRARVLAELRARRRRSEPVTATAVDQADGRLYREGLRQFGSWPAVLAAIGVPPHLRVAPRPGRPPRQGSHAGRRRR